MTVILGLGVVFIAVGVLALLPLSLGFKDKPLSIGFYEGFKVCMGTGFTALLLAGILLIVTPT